MTDHYWTSEDKILPVISDERLGELLEKIEPLVSHEGALHRIVMPDPRKVSFIWDPKYLDAVPVYETLSAYPTVHTCGYYGFFKPSIAECLAALPEDTGEANAFCMTPDIPIGISKRGDRQYASITLLKVLPS